MTSAKACPVREQWAGSAGRCVGGWLGVWGAGLGGGDVTGWGGAAGALLGETRPPRLRSLKAASRTEQLVSQLHPALSVMSLSSSLSRFLRTRVHSILKKSVHSVAVIGAPFSQGQVRTGTWQRGVEPGESGGGVRDGEARRWGETERRTRWRVPTIGHRGSTWGFPW